jgi:uncharacterized membrane protein YfcA
MVPLGIGGGLGPVIVRRSPPKALRVLIAALGLVLAATLGWRAYR